MEPKVIFLAVVADLTTSLVLLLVAVGLVYFGLVGEKFITGMSNVADFLPALALGSVAGLKSKAHPIKNSLAATLLSWSLLGATIILAVLFFKLEPHLAESDVIFSYVLPLIASLVAAYIAFRLRLRTASL